MGTHDLSYRWHAAQLGSVDNEIARLAFICGIRILDPGVVERVIAGDQSVCCTMNEVAFNKLRVLIAVHYTLTVDSVKALGAEESRKILDTVRDRLRERFDLGGS